MADDVSWAMIFAFIVWNIRKARNEVVFEGVPSNHMLVVKRVNMQVKELRAITIHHFGKVAISCWISWSAPDTSFFKLNMDGAAKRMTGNASAGGLLRDETGSWVWGFVVNIGHDSFTAEL